MSSTLKGKGGGCRTPYGGGGEMCDNILSKVDKIMLKFRPIAPKLVSTGSGSGGSTTDNREGYVKCVRSKRKYARVKNTKKMNNLKTKLTLSLLPETPAREEVLPDLGAKNTATTCTTTHLPQPLWVSFNCNNDKDEVRNQVVTKQAPNFLPQLVSNVTVECVTDTWVDVQGLGCTDEERLMNLEKDTCPGFISDSQDRVIWTNKAYRNMAAGGDDVAVVLVRKDTWNQSPGMMMYPAFTCKVRASTCFANSPRWPTSPTLTLPCDGWLMERGGYAWRLDVKAALSLGR